METVNNYMNTKKNRIMELRKKLVSLLVSSKEIDLQTAKEMGPLFEEYFMLEYSLNRYDYIQHPKLTFTERESAEKIIAEYDNSKILDQDAEQKLRGLTMSGGTSLDGEVNVYVPVTSMQLFVTVAHEFCHVKQQEEDKWTLPLYMYANALEDKKGLLHVNNYLKRWFADKNETNADIVSLQQLNKLVFLVNKEGLTKEDKKNLLKSYADVQRLLFNRIIKHSLYAANRAKYGKEVDEKTQETSATANQVIEATDDFLKRMEEFLNAVDKLDEQELK